jgi:MSHA pilin protein MshC
MPRCVEAANVARVSLRAGRFPGGAMTARVAGFSLIELITVIVLLGILAAVAGPQLIGTQQVYDDLGFYNNTQSILRYAQKSAVAKRRVVCVAFTGTTVTLTFSSASAYAPAACDTNLVGPGGENPFSITASSATAFAPVPANFTFDALGRPSVGQVINIAGGVSAITVETDTGYVR